MADHASTGNDSVDVAIVGAGPTGLMAANLLGALGVSVRVLEAGAELIDYPRGVGMDDETLRTFQAAGLVEKVLPHTVPNQPLAFVDRKFRDLARMAPSTGDFGWPRRNGFVQPLADRVLLDGLDRYSNVGVEWSAEVTSLRTGVDDVTLWVGGEGDARTVRASYVIGADGGSSHVRKSLGITFDGTSAAAQWLVVDIRNDPIGRPGSYVCADPARPFVSISIPHGIRRFEFMLLPGETEQAATSAAFVDGLLRPFVSADTEIDVIRRRVYVHHSRTASRFREQRVFLVGDAAHVMPVWQGQGYNSGIRDVFNLAWKLALVIQGDGGEPLLESYEQERREHVLAMTGLSTWVGRAVSVRNPVAAAARDAFFHGISVIPRIKNYIVQMRFKPMPTIEQGAITQAGVQPGPNPVGRLFPQPTVATHEAAALKFDDAIGLRFALVTWNNDPTEVLDSDALARLERLGARLISARPVEQLNPEAGEQDGRVLSVGDIDGALMRWFDAHPESVVLLRPDRIIGGASPGHAASAMIRAFARGLGSPEHPVLSTDREGALT